MQVTIKTPFGEMSFNMTQDKANDLMKKALDYATGQEEKEETPARPASIPQEPPKTIKPKDKPRSRVESLFGDFRGSSVSQEEKGRTGGAGGVQRIFTYKVPALRKSKRILQQNTDVEVHLRVWKGYAAARP